MIFSDTDMRELGSGITYNTHNTTSLIRTLKYVPDILQTEEAFTVKEYTHTHTHASNKLVIARLSRKTWSIFSLFPIFCCCFTRLKGREISLQNIGNYIS